MRFAVRYILGIKISNFYNFAIVSHYVTEFFKIDKIEQNMFTAV